MVKTFQKRFFTSVTLMALFCLGVQAQEPEKKESESYQFTPVKVLEISPVQDQAMTGTCWSFSGSGFLDSEVYRLTGKRVLLSPMYNVAISYKDKARDFVRYQGHNNYSQGGGFFDVLYVLKHYGVVPFEEYTGLLNSKERYNHSELEAITKGYIENVVSEMMKAQSLSPTWSKGFDGIVDAYLGQVPEKFTWEGKEYTPEQFAKFLKLDADNYISLTSYTHHPFYEPFVLEIPDNWRHEQSYNLPIDEFMEVVDYALNNGYSIAWGTDVSEPGFTRDGLAVLPDAEAAASSRGSDMARWVGANANEKRQIFQELVHDPKAPEVEVTQEYRQEGFNNLSLTDDHGMLIYGIAKDQNGKPFYMVKNSWGTGVGYDGTWYASKAFVAGKTMNITIHKDALPKAIRQKLGL